MATLNNRSLVLLLLSLSPPFVLSRIGAAEELPMYAPDRDEVIGKYEIPAAPWKRFVANGYLPLRTTFLTDKEIAQKLDLSLPQLGEVKAALERDDAVALRKALGTYLDTRLPPFHVEKPAKPIPYADSPVMCQRPDTWLG